MSTQGIPQSGEGSDVQVWDPQRTCRRITRAEALLSRGFLRCRPERWFPGLVGQWTPVMHAFGCEVAVTDIRPSLARPPAGGHAFLASVAGEPLVLAVDPDGAEELAAELVPGAESAASRVVLEYIMRRLFFTLVTSWTGPETVGASFEGAAGNSAPQSTASVKLGVSINTTPFTVWFGLGPKMVETLDGLWRRQVQSTGSRAASGSVQARIEVAQLGVPPQMLSEYLKAGTVIDLEVRASDTLTVRVGGKAWMPGRMVNVDGFFGCEVAPGAISAPAVPEGTTRLSVELGSVAMEGGQLAEFGQAGAVLLTQTPVSENVLLVINQEVVGKARLCVYEGRFAIEVL